MAIAQWNLWTHPAGPWPLQNRPLNAQDTKVSSKNAKHSTAAECPCCAPAKGVASTSSQKCNLPSLRRERDDKTNLEQSDVLQGSEKQAWNDYNDYIITYNYSNHI